MQKNNNNKKRHKAVANNPNHASRNKRRTLAKVVCLRPLTLCTPILRLFLTNPRPSFLTAVQISEPRRSDFLLLLSLFSPASSPSPNVLNAGTVEISVQTLSRFFFFFRAEALRGCSQLFGPWVHFKHGEKKKEEAGAAFSIGFCGCA